MFDFAWSEIIVIAAVALIVIGPKDLPKVLRTVGVWIGKARAIAREFQGSLDQMIRESELDDVRKQVEKAATINLDHEIEKTLDPAGEIKQALSEPTISDHTVPPPEIVPPPVPLAAVEPMPAPPEPAAAPAEPTPAPAEPMHALAEPTPAPAEPEVEAPAKSGTHA